MNQLELLRQEIGSQASLVAVGRYDFWCVVMPWLVVLFMAAVIVAILFERES